MEKVTKDFIEIAYRALQSAYYNESKGMTDLDSESVKEVGNVLQAVGDLSRR
jgi:hypothetical protein